MDGWQKSHLAKSRVRLVQETFCVEPIFSHLLFQGVLEQVDVDHIKRKTDRFEQATLLYDIVETRKNGYVGMARALAEASQTGPCKVFMDGFAEHVAPNIKIDFLGETRPLTDLFPGPEMKRLVDAIKSQMSLEEYISYNDKWNNASPITLLVETIPKEIPFYMPRSLNKRWIVDRKLFKESCPDVFVFQGINCSQVTRLAGLSRGEVAYSSSQLHARSTRFVILEAEQDWEEIYSTARVPAHLIKYEEENDRYVLCETTGGSTVIHLHLKHEHNSNGQRAGESVIVSEEQFLEEMSTRGGSGVCICDLAGTGKTILLANLARKMKQKHNDRIVAFIQLSQFEQFVLERREEQPIVMDATFARKVLLKFLTRSQFEYFLVTQLLNKIVTTQLELFFDDFTEVKPGQVSLAKKLLTLLASLPNTRIFVTSCPSMRRELKVYLRLTSYDIVPFSLEKQIDFIVSFWKKLKSTNSPAKLYEFAKFCIGELKARLAVKEGEITGIPLQCQLVAHVLSRAANMFAKAQGTVSARELCPGINSLFDLYRAYCDLQFSKVTGPVNTQGTSESLLISGAHQAKSMMEAVAGAVCCRSELQEIKNFHMAQSLNLLFPEYSELLTELFRVTTEPEESKILSIGILQRQLPFQFSFQFVHQTFAEYLVAEFFAKILDGKIHSDLNHDLLDLLTRKGMSTTLGSFPSFIYPVVMHFFNSACANMIINPKHDTPAHLIYPRVIHGKVLECIIRENHINTLLVLKPVLSTADRSLLYRHIDLKKKSYFVFRLLNAAGNGSSLFLVEQLFPFLRDCFDVDLDGRDKHMFSEAKLYVFNNPLVAALRRRNYDLVKFFADRQPLKGFQLLKECIQHSCFKTAEDIRGLIGIYKYLLDKDQSLIAEVPLVLVESWYVHLDVIKFFLQNGVDPRASNEERSLVHRAVIDLSEKDFIELCRVLVEDFGAVDLFEKVKGKWKSPLPEILANSSISDETIQKIYCIPWLGAYETENTSQEAKKQKGRIMVDINEMDDRGRTLLMCAAIGKRSILKMIDMCSDASVEDTDGRTIAHYIAKNYSPEKYHEITKLLISKGMKRAFGVADMDRRTPLHEAVIQMELLSETLDLLVCRSPAQNVEQQLNGNTVDNGCIDINATDLDGKSILYLAVEERRSLTLVQHLVAIGAELPIRTEKCPNLAHLSAALGLPDHVKYFVELGCDINEVDCFGNNTLQCAVVHQQSEFLLEMVQFLVANGAEKQHKNMKGNTAYEMAIVRRSVDTRVLDLLK